MTASTPSTSASAAVAGEHGAEQRRAINRAAVGIGLYAGLFGLTFGAVSRAAGLDAIETVGMSVVMFTGASQFALVGILGGGGAPFAALAAALLLGLRNAFYGVAISARLRPRGLRRLLTAHFVIDETTAMTVAQRAPEAGRQAFWATSISLCSMWVLGTAVGALVGGSIDTTALGLDAAAPAIFLALLWSQLGSAHAPAVAIGAVVVALALVTITPAGVPIIAAAAVAIVAGLLPARSAPPAGGNER